MHSPDSAPAFTPGERSMLLDLAQRSISHGLESTAPLPIDPAGYPEKLRQQLACFVTLHRFSHLRGCIGHLEAVQPLVADVSENAFAAAFRDPRFAPLERNELEGLELDISVLTPATKIEISSEAELLEILQPGVDGVILKLGRQQGTFLPSVWESLPDPRSFLAHLKLKAGLPQAFWSDQIRVFRYQTESFASPFQAATPSPQ